MDSTPISFQYIGQDASRGAHGDLQIRIGTHRTTADTYYFLIDDTPGLPTSLRGRLARLLDQWLQLIDHLEPDRAIYLPFGFFDQCTGWLRLTYLRQTEGEVLVEGGWSLVHGYTLPPGNVVDAAIGITDFEACGEESGMSTKTTLGKLGEAIRRDRDALLELITDVDGSPTHHS